MRNDAMNQQSYFLSTQHCNMNYEEVKVGCNSATGNLLYWRLYNREQLVYLYICLFTCAYIPLFFLQK